MLRIFHITYQYIGNFIWSGKYPTHFVLGRGNCLPTLFGSGKCPHTIYQEGENVLSLVLGRGKCPEGEEMSREGGGKCPFIVCLYLPTNCKIWIFNFQTNKAAEQRTNLKVILFLHYDYCKQETTIQQFTNKLAVV